VGDREKVVVMDPENISGVIDSCDALGKGCARGIIRD
jgi:hypothetical protein